jgi:3'-5' exoribonuclease
MDKQYDYAIQPDLCNESNYEYIAGNYYLIGFAARLNDYQNPFWEIKLADGTSSLDVFCFKEESYFEKLKPETIFYFMLNKSTSATAEYWECTFADNAKVDGRMLCLPPITWAVNPLHLTRLARLIDMIQSNDLRTFLFEVLSVRDTVKRFLTCPASLQHHHNYSGGLLDHCLEVAESLAWNSNLSNAERQQGIVAGLVHDIGKIMTMTADMKRTRLGTLTDHDALTLFICANQLKTLETKNKKHAELLIHAWTCNSPKSRYGHKPYTNVAKALQIADKNSASKLMRYLAVKPTEYSRNLSLQLQRNE